MSSGYLTPPPVVGCSGCSTSIGALGCPYHGPRAKSQVRTVTTRQYRMECVSCRGSGQSQRPKIGQVGYEVCQGCEGKGYVHVNETTTVG